MQVGFTMDPKVYLCCDPWFEVSIILGNVQWKNVFSQGHACSLDMAGVRMKLTCIILQVIKHVSIYTKVTQKYFAICEIQILTLFFLAIVFLMYSVT